MKGSKGQPGSGARVCFRNRQDNKAVGVSLPPVHAVSRNPLTQVKVTSLALDTSEPFTFICNCFSSVHVFRGAGWLGNW